MKTLFLAGMLAASLCSPVFAANKPAEDTKTEVPELTSFVTKHKGKFNGKTVSYTATVSNMHLTNKEGDVTGDAVTTAYVAESDENRPVTFVFNGGPGSSSVWLHMGIFGPKYVEVPSDAQDAGNAPYKILHNPLSPLDKTDLVFIDPIGTGFSQLAGEGTAKDFWSIAADAESVSAVVKQWIAKNNRWNSPKFIAGESYGTTRAAAMLPYLNDRKSPLRINGLILISQALDYAGSTPEADNMISFVTYLPTMAATAWYHGKIDKNSISLEKLVEDAKEFATDEYLPALFKGSALPAAEFDKIAAKLAYFTGLNETLIKRGNLRVDATRQRKLLLADQGIALGRSDSRYTIDEIDDLDITPKYDASSTGVSGAYNAALRHYLMNDLKVTWDRDYLVSNRDVGRNWVYYRDSGREPHTVNTSADLAEGMRVNPSMKVMLASGYYDYATPLFDGDYTFGRYGIDNSRVIKHNYEAGHMMYLHKPDMEKLAKDISAFYDDMKGNR